MNSESKIDSREESESIGFLEDSISSTFPIPKHKTKVKFSELTLH